MEICEVCKCDISADGFACPKRLCPLDNFHPAGTVEIPDASTGPKRRKAALMRYLIFPQKLTAEKGQPAPSESLTRYDN
jgi:hypothetical protein